MSTIVVDREDFGSLIDVLRARGFTVVGPTVREQAIVYAALDSVEDLPAGWTDEHSGGAYRLQRRDDEALFGYVVGPESWKKYLFPPRSTLLTVRRVDGGLVFAEPDPATVNYAFIGARACELAAIAIQDKVFLDSGYIDRTYQMKRQGLFVVGVNCAIAGGNCFCVSMGTGPECTDGYDLVVTEIVDDRHEFVIESGSEAGEEVLAALPGRPAGPTDHSRVAAIVADTAAHMGRQLDTAGIKELLYESREHPRWDEVAARCLACTNCTLVCPTCFCSTTEDTADLDGAAATRTRRWDSCFTMDFSALHGAPVRQSTRARYRQWMTHKLASWYDQFDTSGCVGCGRCITWCPVGIDITEETAAIRAGSEVPA